MSKPPAWYSYGQILFRYRHVKWICDNAVSLSIGKWPREPRNTGYTDAPISTRKIKAEGTFVKPTLVWAEVEIRLTECGMDGHLAIGYYRWEVPVDWLAKAAQCSEYETERRIRRAVSYAGSGPCRRWQGCEACYKGDTCPQKGDRLLLVRDYKHWVRKRR